jgi:uncharacterized protein
VESRVEETKRIIGDPELGWMFENCFPNTLDTTVRTGELNGKPDTFVITGDIDAMWLRDSTAQVWPYLPLAKQDPKLQRMLAGVTMATGKPLATPRASTPRGKAYRRRSCGPSASSNG